MENKEYAKAKQECWEEYIAKHGFIETADVKGIFDFAFDRAYALGMQDGGTQSTESKSMQLSDVKEKIDAWMESHTKEEVYELLKKCGAIEEAEPKFKRGDRVKMKYNMEYTVLDSEPITDKYMYSLLCDNKSWHGMELESKLTKVENNEE